MKALTLTQPWATLVAIGAKHIETRGWQTSYRGPLAIHAGSTLAPVGGRRGLHALCGSEPFPAVLTAAGYGADRVPAWGLHLGKIVAVARLDAVYPTVPEGFATHDPRGSRFVDVGEPERSFGDYSPGRYAWLLADVRALPEPVPCRGYQQLWDVPADVAAAIREQIGDPRGR